MLRLATWNVNSVRIRTALLDKLAKEEMPDIICLQEVKAKEADFPFEDIRALGYCHIALYSMPGYNGVAILSKTPLHNIEKHMHVGRNDARHISATTENGLEIHNIYVPAGGDIPDTATNPSFIHKLAFVDEAAAFFKQRKGNRLLACGDFNIAPLPDDVWSHKAMSKIISHTPIEIEKLTDFFNQGNFTDAVRKHYPEPQKLYSWWSYRNPNWLTNDKGRRLDHIWVRPEILPQVAQAQICKDFRSAERPSDHVPVIIDLEI
uniref:Exodeoxyribonuclease III n=1 Tax=uncultured Alphaproteobacteria bacterium TaxID=91750 RepID=A0A6G8F2X0_9PROT|nr:exodeoxyribonuclease III [uncultured Alphaproteobacteria bacterium]